MNETPVDTAALSTIRSHNENGSPAGPTGVVPVVLLSMYYDDLFIP